MLFLTSFFLLFTPKKKKKNYMHNFKDKFLIVFCGLLHIQVQRQKKNTSLLQISFFLSFLYTPTHTYIYVLFRIRPLRILYITIHLLDRVSFLFSNSFFPVFFFFLVLAVFCDSFFFFLVGCCCLSAEKKRQREKKLFVVLLPYFNAGAQVGVLFFFFYQKD